MQGLTTSLTENGDIERVWLDVTPVGNRLGIEPFHAEDRLKLQVGAHPPA